MTNYPIAYALQWVGTTMCKTCITIAPWPCDADATVWRNFCGDFLYDPGARLIGLSWDICPADRDLPEYD